MNSPLLAPQHAPMVISLVNEHYVNHVMFASEQLWQVFLMFL
jgi:hypothetical protein